MALINHINKNKSKVLVIDNLDRLARLEHLKHRFISDLKKSCPCLSHIYIVDKAFITIAKITKYINNLPILLQSPLNKLNNRISSEQQALIKAYKALGYSNRAIAKLVACSKDTVKSYLTRPKGLFSKHRQSSKKSIEQRNLIKKYADDGFLPCHIVGLKGIKLKRSMIYKHSKDIKLALERLLASYATSKIFNKEVHFKALYFYAIKLLSGYYSYLLAYLKTTDPPN